MKRLTIERHRGHYGAVRALLIEIDGDVVAKLRQNASVDIDYPDTATILRGRMYWGRTSSVDLTTVPDGARLILQGKFTMKPAQNLGAGVDLPFAFRVEPGR